MLNVEVDVASILAALPLEDTLGDGGDGRVVTSFDGLEGLCEAAVVISDFWGPGDAGSICKVPL